MKPSTSLDKISSALLKAQKQIKTAKKDLTNPFFKSKYADINSVLDACKEALNENGIVVAQPHDLIETESGAVVCVVETVLLHESGQYISGRTPAEVSKKNDPQALGSAITYARRYGLQSILGMNAEDDDGNAGSGKQKPKTTTNNRTEAAKKVSSNGWG